MIELRTPNLIGTGICSVSVTAASFEEEVIHLPPTKAYLDRLYADLLLVNHSQWPITRREYSTFSPTLQIEFHSSFMSAQESM